MKKNFQDQFENLKSIIETNVSTLKSLLKQSDHLSEIIQQMGDTDSVLKNQLEDSKKNIAESIDILVLKTQELFKVYEELVDKVFRS